MRDPAPLLLSIPSYAGLAERLAAATGWAQAEVERKTFSDGETYQRIVTPLREHPVVLVAGTASERDTLLAYDLASAAVRWGASRLTWVLPYFGYQTMERAVRPQESVVAKSRATLIASLPTAPLGNRVLLLDLHAAGIAYYFDAGTPAFHLYGKSLVFEAAREFADGGPFVLAAPDAGRAKWVESLADDLGVPVAYASKRRGADGTTRVTGLDADVRDQVVVIYDDMIRSGSTLLGAARAFLEAGASRCYAVTTHLVLPEGAPERLFADGLLQGVAGTDSHPRAQGVAHDPRFRVRSVAPLLARWLQERP
ncbi:MAG: ribose-phosphate diphosphokinase [Planctomycetota bacterium]